MKKKILRALGYIFLVLLALQMLFVGLAWWYKEAIIKSATHELEVATNGGVSIGKVKISVFGHWPDFGVQIDSLRIGDSTQTVTDGVSTKITFDTEEFDTNNNFASSRFTPTVAGYYYISASVTNRQTNITDSVVMIFKNGSQFKRGFEFGDALSTQDGLGMSVASLIYFNGSTDYVEIYLYSDGTGNSSVIGDASSTFFTGYLARTA
jgi:hypothetical protein